MLHFPKALLFFAISLNLNPLHLLPFRLRCFSLRNHLQAVLLEDKSEEQIALLKSLEPSSEVSALLALWKEGGIFLWEKPDKTKVAVTLAETKTPTTNRPLFPSKTR